MIGNDYLKVNVGGNTCWLQDEVFCLDAWEFLQL